jgi:hypothetical protein
MQEVGRMWDAHLSRCVEEYYRESPPPEQIEVYAYLRDEAVEITAVGYYDRQNEDYDIDVTEIKVMPETNFSIALKKTYKFDSAKLSPRNQKRILNAINEQVKKEAYKVLRNWEPDEREPSGEF